jgi:alpha-glucosidase
MSLSGMFNIGHDVAGFSGPAPEPELLVRFTQAGVLHPRFLMNSWKADGTITTPWLHPETQPAIRWAIRLRYRLLPYLYTLYRRAAEHAEPILRPTFFDFTEDPANFAENDELMLGPFLLAAPVVEEGARQRRVYLPAGPEGWYDFYAETWHQAGETALLAAPLERLPLLVPAGAILPLTGEACDFARLQDEPSRCIRIFPGRESGQSSFTLYEDDGLSLRHREGDFAELDFRLDWDGDTVRLRLAKRSGYTLPYHSITVALPTAERRRLVLESAPGAPLFVAGQWRFHSLHA